jgi:hypothetical protein
MFTKLEVPAALPMVLSGLKVGATLAVIVAVVGEFVNSDRGLGFLIKQGNGEYNTARTFAALIALIVMALLMYGSVALLERKWLAWRNEAIEACMERIRTKRSNGEHDETSSGMVVNWRSGAGGLCAGGRPGPSGQGIDEDSGAHGVHRQRAVCALLYCGR